MGRRRDYTINAEKNASRYRIKTQVVISANRK